MCSIILRFYLRKLEILIGCDRLDQVLTYFFSYIFFIFTCKINPGVFDSDLSFEKDINNVLPDLLLPL